jgi:hypothetical protein
MKDFFKGISIISLILVGIFVILGEVNKGESRLIGLYALPIGVLFIIFFILYVLSPSDKPKNNPVPNEPQISKNEGKNLGLLVRVLFYIFGIVAFPFLVVILYYVDSDFFLFAFILSPILFLISFIALVFELVNRFYFNRRN